MSVSIRRFESALFAERIFVSSTQRSKWIWRMVKKLGTFVQNMKGVKHAAICSIASIGSDPFWSRICRSRFVVVHHRSSGSSAGELVFR